MVCIGLHTIYIPIIGIDEGSYLRRVFFHEVIFELMRNKCIGLFAWIRLPDARWITDITAKGTEVPGRLNRL
jgi:hypothetical protein